MAKERAELVAARAICLALPEVTERLSHGAPTWFAGKKTVGLTAGGDAVELQLFLGVGQTSVSSISVAYGTALFPDPTLNGLPVTVAIWEDPNDDGLPNDLVLLATAPSTINPALAASASNCCAAPICASAR